MRFWEILPNTAPLQAAPQDLQAAISTKLLTQILPKAMAEATHDCNLRQSQDS